MENMNKKQLINLEGFVSKRRAIGKSLVFLDIIPSELPQIETHQNMNTFIVEDIASIKPVQALMRRDVWKAINTNTTCTQSHYDVYQKIIQPGVYCSLTGEAGPSRLPNEALLFCHSASYKLPNNNPQHLRNVVRFARDGLLDLDEACAALPCISKEELHEMLIFTDENGQHNKTNGECAAEILSRFPINFLKNPSKLMGNSNSAKVALLPPVPDHYKPPLGLSFESLGSSGNGEFRIGQLLEKLQHKVDQIEQYTFSGWVQNRRRFQDSVTVVEVVQRFSSSTEIMERMTDIDMTKQSSNFSRAWSERIHVVIDPNSIGDIKGAEMYGNILATGSRVLILGHVTSRKDSKMTICWASSCQLLHSSWKLNAVRLTLELLHMNKIDVCEAADALQLDGGYAQAEEIANGSTTSEYRQWLAAEISRSLQGEHSRHGKITAKMTRSLEMFGVLRDKFPIEPVGIEQSDSTNRLHSNSSSHVVNPVSRWERAKKPQLKWMISQISDVLESHPEFGQRTLKVCDIGGGKGLLSNLMAETFGDKVEVKVVDISRAAINNGAMKARRRGIQNVSFESQDASAFNAMGFDVVIALHACGALSDVALGHAVSNGAVFVICPW